MTDQYADGTTTVESPTPATDPPIDCFYVYPTVSGQPGANANLNIDPVERAIAMQQASRFSQVCKVYAPMYRQMTLTEINLGASGADLSVPYSIAYSDVLAAWQDYLANYNHGRGVVFISHSQGTMMLSRLIATEIDPNPSLRSLVVSALLIGGNIRVPVGQDVGGDFQNIPACRSTSQTGCVVAYSSFNQTPPTTTFFGKVGVGPSNGLAVSGDVEVLCVNPASLAGGSGALQMQFGTAPFPGILGLWLPWIPSAPTPWLAYPGLYTGHCESSDGVNWLQVDSAPGDPRPVVSAAPDASWGLHLFDTTLAMGNLVDLVRQQSAAYGP